MIFQHSWQAILDGRKTQTRRIVKPGDELFVDYIDPTAVMRRGQSAYRTIFEVGKDYAVQPGRGKKAVARIRILSIRREDVRTISDADVKAEGFEWRSVFLETWCNMHDRAAITDSRSFWLENIHERPAERYDAWALTFEVVK